MEFLVVRDTCAQLLIAKDIRDFIFLEFNHRD